VPYGTDSPLDMFQASRGRGMPGYDHNVPPGQLPATLLRTANRKTPTANCQLPTANCQLPTLTANGQPYRVKPGLQEEASND